MDNKRGTFRPYEGLVSLSQRLTDLALIVLARYIACAVYPQDWTERDTLVTLAGLLIFSVAGGLGGIYRSWRGLPFRREASALLWSWCIVAPPLLASGFLAKSLAEHSRVINTSWFLLAPVLMLAVRGLARFTLFKLRSQGRNTRAAGVIGATAMARKLIDELRSNPSHGIQVVGVYDDPAPDGGSPALQDLALSGDIARAVQVARAGDLDLVYIALPLRCEARIKEVVAALADTTATVQLVTDFSIFDLMNARWSAVGEIPAVTIFGTPFHGIDGWAKRLEDIALGSLLTAFSTPLMAIIALAIKLSSKGPVLFGQTRYGLNGRPFRVYKFCTMTPATETRDGVAQATRNDPRVTRLGAFLRSTSLDELPQFFNVLKGDMSIVGPRPHAVEHNELYRGLIRGYMLRHKVRPGITGWAQVNGYRGETNTIDKMQARVRYDLDYIENWRLSWDLQIIVRTITRMLRDPNAY